ncbi:hypothetical protein [Bacillus massilinigeriensis]|uniref:hypothetical protein n=1 Tax=Bacillus massilionigeriensis TaxID=1805475 RepID=UPI00096B0766|nr:hypothetical protein [Bacillus massilionigeriensis]
MKKISISVLLIPLLFSFLWINEKKAYANENNNEGISEFAKALEDSLKDTINYYHENSSVILDSVDIQGNVFKTISADDPDTEENEEKTEEYTSHIIAGYIEYEQKRDSLFIFKKKDVYYYDLDKKEFLTASNVFGNEEIKSFFQKYMHHLEKEITPLSSTIAMIFISSILIFPLIILIFHHQGNRISGRRYSEDRNLKV